MRRFPNALHRSISPNVTLLGRRSMRRTSRDVISVSWYCHWRACCILKFSRMKNHVNWVCGYRRAEKTVQCKNTHYSRVSASHNKRIAVNFNTGTGRYLCTAYFNRKSGNAKLVWFGTGPVSTVQARITRSTSHSAHLSCMMIPRMVWRLDAS